jgi:hypothetical protein
MYSNHWNYSDYIKANKSSIHNKESVLKSKNVGCYQCLKIYPSSLITDYIDEAENTAICSKCGIDAVLCDYDGYPIKIPEYLDHMNWYGFCHVTLRNGCRTTTRRPSCLTCLLFEDRDFVYPDCKYKIRGIKIISSICPFQLEGFTDNDQHVYVRERSNIVRIDIDGLTVYRKKLDNLIFNFEDLKCETQEWFTWPIFKE